MNLGKRNSLESRDLTTLYEIGPACSSCQERGGRQAGNILVIQGTCQGYMNGRLVGNFPFYARLNRHAKIRLLARVLAVLESSVDNVEEHAEP